MDTRYRPKQAHIKESNLSDNFQGINVLVNSGHKIVFENPSRITSLKVSDFNALPNDRLKLDLVNLD
jgi:hypothetical protein